MKALTKLFASIIVATLAVVFTSCGEDDFDYDPQAENRTIYTVESVTFNDNNLDKDFEGYDAGRHRSYAYCDSPTLKAYYENYFKEFHLLAWDNGKYEVNVFALRETTEPQKPTKKNGKIRLSYDRTKHDDYNWDEETWFYGTITLVEVGHNRYDCEVWDKEFDVTFSATIQLDEGTR